MKLKRIISNIIDFFGRHSFAFFVISIIMVIISAPLIFATEKFKLIAASCLSFAYSGYRLYTYKYGNLFLFSRDRTFNYIESINTEEESKDKYKKMSIIHAMVALILGFIMFIAFMTYMLILEF